MKDEKTDKRLQYELHHSDPENNTCSQIHDVSIMVHKKKVKNRKKVDLVKCGQQPAVAFRLSRSNRNSIRKFLTTHITMTEINKRTKLSQQCTRSTDAIQKKSFFNSKFVVNRVSDYHLNEFLKNSFTFPTQKKWKVYRYQLSVPQERCCCSCNSDAMFEVMKGLYDCYKMKNCDNCTCILCSHKLQKERRLGEEQKSLATLDAKAKKSKLKKAEKMLDGKTAAEKEEILKELAKTGQPLPKGKTASEKALVKKVKEKMGVPVSKTTTMSEKIKKTKAAQVTPSQKLKKSKAGPITTLEGKTPSQKENILKELAMQGLPLPEGKTASEKKLINKVRADLGLPPEPKTASMKEKYAKAADAGLMKPLEGKSPSEKERILQGLHDKGIPLPEGRTASEKAIISKVKAGERPPPVPLSEKLKKAKAAELITPLEGKTPSEKEKILKSMQDKGIPLPEGRTSSEKALIAKVKAGTRAPSAKLAKAKAAGLVTPLERKTPSQKELFLKRLAMQGLPLPEPKTASEKKLIDKVRADLGLPPEPKTASMKEKHAKAANAGLMQPLEGKSPSQKERILQGLHDKGIPLPNGRTASEKAIISKVKAGVRAPSMTPSEKLRKAIAAGLRSPLEGKTPSQKEKILKTLAKEGHALPEPKSASEKKIISRVRADLGLPPEPKTVSMREKYEAAADLGLLQPLEGKSPAEKERILKSLQDKGIPLPEGRTASEKAIIAKVKQSTAKPYKKPAGFGARPLPPAKRRKLDQKTAKKVKEGKGPVDECICGLLTPEPEKEILKSVKEPTTKAPGPSITSDKLKKAKAAGILTPLEGKSPEQKEKILRGLAKSGLPLPQGKTASDKAMIKKIKTELRVPEKTTSEKIKKAIKSGLLTPLEGKTPLQKEKILRGRAAAGLPLPVGKTPSDRALIQKIKEDTGYVSPTQSERLKRAKDAGLLTPLEGKSPSAKEKILRDRVAAGVPLPEGATLSEKEIVRKITAGEPPAVMPPSDKQKIPSKVTSEKLQKAKEAGLLTPLTGKSPKEKERILKGLIEKDLPLPESQTESEKKIAAKVRKELGLPPEPKTASEKSKMRKAEAAGIVTPLEGKTPSQKERILKDMAKAEIPLPEGRTASEKELIKKVRAEAGLPPKPTPYEKRGEIKPKLKKSGISPSKQRLKTIPAGISEKLEEVVKTTTCDRGCGCDKKKIRFKHSYVKIRVTSPDISSLCDCPNECLPGVKAGAFIDNEGIKVTIGRVNGVTSFTSQTSNRSLDISNNVITLYGKTLTDSYSSNTSTDIVNALSVNASEASDLKMSLFGACLFPRYPINVDKLNTEVNTSCTYTSGSYDSYTNSKFINADSSKSNCVLESSSHENYSDETDRLVHNFRKTSTFSFHECSVSYDSIVIKKTESSLSLITDSGDSIDETSMLSLCSSSSYNAKNSTQYLYYLVSTDYLSEKLGETQLSLNRFDYSNNDDIGNDSSEDSGDDTMMSSENESDGSMAQLKSPGNTSYGTDYTKRKQNKYFTYLLPQTKLDSNNFAKQNYTRTTDGGDPIVVISNMDSEFDITALVNQLLTKNDFSDTSSIFVVVPSSDDNESELESDCSTICIQLSSYQPKWNQKQCNIVEPSKPTRRILSSPRGMKISAKGKLYCMEGMQPTVASFHNKKTMFDNRIPNVCSHKVEKNKTENRKNKLCQITTPNETITFYHSVSTDTTRDRPCCCPPKIQENKTQHEYGCVANVVSELITPVLENQGINCNDYRRFAKMNVIQQASFVSINSALTSVTPCVIPPYHGHPGCHPGDMFPYDTPILTPFCGSKYSQMSEVVFNPSPSNMFEPGFELKQSEPVSERRDEKQSKPCQCNPEKIKEMFELVLRGKVPNLKTTGCGGATDNPPTQPPTQPLTQPLTKPPTKPPANASTNQAAYNKHQSINIKPAFKPLCNSGNDKDVCGNYPNQNINKKMKCACSGRERTVKIGSFLCPCEHYPPPVSMTTFGPNVGTMSTGCQCCCCDDSIVKAASELQVLGPTGGVCQMEPGGTSCQAGRKPKALDPRKYGSNRVCVTTDGKNYKNVTCECLPTELEPEPETEPDEYVPGVRRSLYQIHQWIDEKQVLRQKSDMTQTQSGFRISQKKKRPLPPDPECTVEDAVRYYVTINPDLLKDFFPEPKECPCKDLDTKKPRKSIFSRNNKIQCQCPAPKRVPPKAAHSKDALPSEPEPEPKPEDEAPTGGIKFSIGGKGSGSKGLNGVCCFDMIQETNISRTKHS